MSERYGRRIKAARAYAGFSSVDALGAEIGVSGSTIKRWEGDGPKPPRPDLRAKIAEVCRVPPEFIERGFPTGEEPTVEERLDALEQQMATVLRRLVSRGAASAGEPPAVAEDP